MIMRISACSNHSLLGWTLRSVILGRFELSRGMHTVNLADSLTILAFDVVVVVRDCVHVDSLSVLVICLFRLR